MNATNSMPLCNICQSFHYIGEPCNLWLRYFSIPHESFSPPGAAVWCQDCGSKHSRIADCPLPESSLDTQEGGNHYKSMKIQPVEYIHANGIGYFEGCVIKYVSRWKNKNGIEDLRKAKHFIDLLIELETKDDRDTAS